MQTQEIVVRNRLCGNVEMKEDAVSIDEVVVVALVRRKREWLSSPDGKTCGFKVPSSKTLTTTAWRGVCPV